jgi:uncharacterized protein YbjT (DUF2867 family)
MIVITGASGKTGSKAAELLLAKKMPVRGVGRVNDRLRRLNEKGAEIMTGDQSDLAFLIKAFQGADAVYLLIPSKPEARDQIEYYDEMGDIAIAAIKIAKVRKIVFLSSLLAFSEPWNAAATGLLDVERKLDSLGEVDMIALRAGYLVENLFEYAKLSTAQRFRGYATLDSRPVNMITAVEIGEKVAELLGNPVFTGHSVVSLDGRKWFFYPQVASNVIDRPILSPA